ncbi:ABC transporter ATP-binding protein [Enterovibrio norvegicus FF-33]|uniref:ABC transporter ATP-binding protein n=1 Tax=Enterovibrio norvegicus FF-454 TaxID=1185651 RepID=A0A1E5C9P5_9GAMM|nr:ABC transporter ATP-binding protein [Enterovibrio norvegicus]OEE62254.1 ABC transporter ATP-binding protein [Enterovibrio norvegicus FF-454]OEE65906.1 ABC transporter ATP-binding protein [Enterovibrio norvegicus FF-33]OEE74366.1 ABC transporter ATP-binding protein [Enterovibrio norvegicus FF-162]
MLELFGLCKGYLDGGEFHPVLQGAELSLANNDQVALMGESGSGKSTLLNLIGGLDNPDSGQVWIDNAAIHALSESERTRYRRHYIGMVFQQYNLLPTLTVADNIRFCRQLKGLHEDDSLWRQIISALDLMPLLGRYPEEISGGQQQRAAIARALYMEPKILLADEPTGSLDERNADAVMRLLTTLTKTLDCTLLVVTHSEKVADYLGQRVTLQGGVLNVRTRS